MRQRALRVELARRHGADAAESPFNRMGQHHGFADNSHMLRRHLMQHGAVPESCAFRLIALGPIEQEAITPGREHDQRRGQIAAMEEALAELPAASGLEVMNRRVSRKPGLQSKS
jgi:hypothetical protein